MFRRVRRSVVEGDSTRPQIRANSYGNNGTTIGIENTPENASFKYYKNTEPLSTQLLNNYEKFR